MREIYCKVNETPNQPQQTMDDRYGDDSPHAVCNNCGMCVTCGDCKCSLKDCTTCKQQYREQLLKEVKEKLEKEFTVRMPLFWILDSTWWHKFWQEELKEK